MFTQLFAIRDIKSGFNQSVLSFPNKEVAIRYFKSISQDVSSLLSQCKEDFELWYLGEMSLKDGSITSAPEFVFSMVGEGK